MNFLEEIFGSLIFQKRVPSLVVTVFCCFVCGNGSAQLIYLTDSRSVSGSASFQPAQVQPPSYMTSYSPFSGSATPSAPFADFGGSASGSAIFVGANSNTLTGHLSPYTNTATISAVQNSYLHPQELYFNSSEFGSVSPFLGSPPYGWVATGNSTLQVTFSVSGPVAYDLSVLGTGDPIASLGTYNLSSADLGVLVNGNTRSMSQADYSGIFNPGDVYTLTLASSGGDSTPSIEQDGGGMIVDLVVPEPSMTDLAGLAFLTLLLRAHRIRRQALRGK